MHQLEIFAYLCRVDQPLSQYQDHSLQSCQSDLHLTVEEGLQHWGQEGLRYASARSHYNVEEGMQIVSLCYIEGNKGIRIMCKGPVHSDTYTNIYYKNGLLSCLSKVHKMHSD